MLTLLLSETFISLETIGAVLGVIIGLITIVGIPFKMLSKEINTQRRHNETQYKELDSLRERVAVLEALNQND